MSNFKLSPIDVFPKSTELKKDKILVELSLKLMQLSVFKDKNITLDAEDNVYLQSALEVYARWLKAQEIMHLNDGDTNTKRKEVLTLLGLEKSKKAAIKNSELRALYLSHTDFNQNQSPKVKGSAVIAIKKELGYHTVDACLSALERASIKNGGMQELKLPGKSSKWLIEDN